MNSLSVSKETVQASGTYAKIRHPSMKMSSHVRPAERGIIVPREAAWMEETVREERVLRLTREDRLSSFRVKDTKAMSVIISMGVITARM